MKKHNFIFTILALLVAIIVTTIWYLITEYPDTSLDTLLYYLFNTGGKTNMDVYKKSLDQIVSFVILICVFLLLPSLKFKKGIDLTLNIFKKKINFSLPLKKGHKRLIALYYIGVIIFTLVKFDQIFKVREYITNNSVNTTNLFSNYIRPEKVEIQFPTQKRNLIVLFIESLETSVCSKNNGGAWPYSIVPELEKLSLDNINFSHTNQIGGAQMTVNATHTTGGIFAQTTGAPMKNPIGVDFNVGKNYESFFKGEYSLSDILAKNDYNQTFIIGSDANFGNFKSFFRSHGNINIIDHAYAQQNGLIPKDYSVNWGFEDKKLYEFSKNEITRLAQLEKPFATIISAVDTHPVDGYFDKSICQKKFNQNYENSYACESQMVNDFISWLKQQQFYDNTSVVIVGDHLGMQTKFYKDVIDPNYQRTVLNVFINSKLRPINEKNRTFSAFDLYPTILASTGAKIKGEKLGLGTNLFSSEKTLSEELGHDILNNELKKQSAYYDNELSYNARQK